MYFKPGKSFRNGVDFISIGLALELSTLADNAKY